ncbi:MAG: imidazolonepropionase [Dokdonella sp.]
MSDHANANDWDGLLVDCRLATMRDDRLGIVENAAVGWKDGVICHAGPRDALPDRAEELARFVESLDGRWITPGLIDCHTHLVFAGDRSGEFEQRLYGADYADIARNGGGIASSVRATRAVSEDELVAQSLPRALALASDGVTTIEIKSGYGLDLESELKMLRAARRVGEMAGMDVQTTFLGAHALPPEFAGRPDDYVDHLCEVMLPRVAQSGLADAVDAFCESIGFSPAQTARVFDAARKLGLPVKLHADQLTDSGGAALSASYNGLSADHIEHTSIEGVRAMAAAGTVAVLLPGAYYALRDTHLPPIGALREHGVATAVATDLNPGTSPLLSLRLAMNMACTLFRLSPSEALLGTTRHAAQALGLRDRGQLVVGQKADWIAWDVEQPAEICYWIGGTLNQRTWRAGVERPDNRT